jgi:hypothetical protein
MRGKTLEEQGIITDSHGEGQELFEGLAGAVELDRDLAGRNRDTRGQALDVLMDHRGGRFHQNPALSLEGVELRRKSSPSAVLVMQGLAGGKSMEVRDHIFAVGHARAANLPADARRQDLLGAPPSDPEQSLERPTIDPSVGKVAEEGRDLVHPATPCRFIRHLEIQENHTTAESDFAHSRTIGSF